MSVLLRLVSDKMGGVIALDDITTFGYEVSMIQLKAEIHSNIVPIGRIRKGIYAQRAFLFKVSQCDQVQTETMTKDCVSFFQTLADRLGMPCTLVRGNYNRAWNEVVLGESSAVNCSTIGQKLLLNCYSSDCFRVSDIQRKHGLSIYCMNQVD